MARRENSLQAVRKPVSIGLMSFCALACAIAVPGVPTLALGDGLPPWAICANNKEATELSTPHLAASPASGATVQAGTPVTFSVKSFSGESIMR